MKSFCLFVTLSVFISSLFFCCTKNDSGKELAKVITFVATDITAFDAMAGGEVISQGTHEVTERGICWGTSPKPTINDDKTVDGSGVGVYKSRITGLIPGFTYFARAYAISRAGIAYGEEITFGWGNELLDLKPGTLEAVITSQGMKNVVYLKLGGEIDQRDFRYMVRMFYSGLTEIDLYNVTIAAYEEYPEGEIPADAFSILLKGVEIKDYLPNYYLRKFVFPKNITSVGDNAFRNCYNWEGPLVIPESVISIGNSAFINCIGLAGDLNIPHNVTSIGDYAFSNCSGLKGSLTIGGNVETIGNHAFSYCIGFTGSLYIGDSVLSIGDSAFNYCKSFNGSLYIGDGVTAIGDNTFQNCGGFSGTLTIGKNVKVIGDEAFSNCYKFTGPLVIPEGVTTIGFSAFYYCRDFSGPLTIPDNVTTIRNGAFYSCLNISGSLIIPENVAYIGVQAFEDCRNITDIKVSRMHPITYSPNMFPEGLTVYVPSVAMIAYETASGWNAHTIRGY